MGTSQQLIKVFADHAKGRVLVGAGCHSTKTSECIELANYADKAGCDFAWITPPPWPASTSEDDIYKHYQMIAENTDIPLGIYNSIVLFVYMSPRLILNILNLSERFVALKDSYGFFSHHVELFRLGIPRKVAYYSVAHDMMSVLQLGTDCVLTGPHQVPLTLACYEAFMKGDMDRAWLLQMRLIEGQPLLGPLAEVLKPAKTWPEREIGRYKAMNSLLMGIEMGPPAPPNTPATEKDIAEIKKHLEKWQPFDVEAPLPDD
jgi:4-hydroxy-tetrahydrodipicolinate synthase